MNERWYMLKSNRHPQYLVIVLVESLYYEINYKAELIHIHNFSIKNDRNSQKNYEKIPSLKIFKYITYPKR
jgi:hypothetical protein